MTTTLSPITLAAFAALVRQLTKKGHRVIDRWETGYGPAVTLAARLYDGHYCPEFEYSVKPSSDGGHVIVCAGDSNWSERDWPLLAPKLAGRISRWLAKVDARDGW